MQAFHRAEMVDKRISLEVGVVVWQKCGSGSVFFLQGIIGNKPVVVFGVAREDGPKALNRG